MLSANLLVSTEKPRALGTRLVLLPKAAFVWIRMALAVTISHELASQAYSIVIPEEQGSPRLEGSSVDSRSIKLGDI